MARHLSFLLIILLFSNCIGQPSEKPEAWESKYHDFKAEYEFLWSLIPGLDTERNMLFSVIDKRDGKSCIVKIAPDVPTEQLSDESYYKAIQDLMLNVDKRNRLLQEGKKQFHGEDYYQMVFLMYTKKWGLLKQVTYILRNGKEMYSVQMSYPVEITVAETAPLPQSLVELNAKIKISRK